MAIILQKQLLGWQEIDELGDLQRLLLVVNHLCRKFMIHTDEVEKIFLRLVDETKTLLPDFGRVFGHRQQSH